MSVYYLKFCPHLIFFFGFILLNELHQGQPRKCLNLPNNHVIYLQKFPFHGFDRSIYLAKCFPQMLAVIFTLKVTNIVPLNSLPKNF